MRDYHQLLASWVCYARYLCWHRVGERRTSCAALLCTSCNLEMSFLVALDQTTEH